MHNPRRLGFTLVELLVVMLIIAVLVGLLLPAVNAARDSARATQSRNNLRQMTLAMLQHETNKSYLPPSYKSHAPITGNVDISGWSIHALLLPYLEQKQIETNIDYSLNYQASPNVVTADGRSIKLAALRIPTFISPAEPRDEARLDGTGTPFHYPTNYAINLGTFLVFDPATRKGGNGAAYPDSRLKTSQFYDGQSATIAFAEVKGWQPYYRNSAVANPTIASTADVCSLAGTSGTTFHLDSGHTEWIDGRAHQIGFTTTFRPNTIVPCVRDGVTYDVDWSNWQEGKGLNAATPILHKTFAAVTARSYFAGLVNVSMMDGSVRSFANDVDLGVWQALSTREGKEILPDYVLR